MRTDWLRFIIPTRSWRDPQGLRGCGFFTVRNGLIVHQRGYWDKLSFLRLHGLPVE